MVCNMETKIGFVTGAVSGITVGRTENCESWINAFSHQSKFGVCCSKGKTKRNRNHSCTASLDQLNQQRKLSTGFQYRVFVKGNVAHGSKSCGNSTSCCSHLVASLSLKGKTFSLMEPWAYSVRLPKNWDCILALYNQVYT